MSIRFKYATIIAVLVLMSFLYVKTNSVDLIKHNQLLEHFNQFMLIDSILNQNILEIRQGLLSFYDPTVGKINKLNQLIDDIERLLEPSKSSHSKPKIITLLSDTTNAINLKRKLIEKFKSTNAIFTNSLRYLPTATNQLSTKLPLDAQGDVVTLLLTEQLRDILIHNYSNDNLILDKFNETNKLLTSIFKNHYAEHLDELDSLQSHANIIVINKKKVDDIVSDILKIPSSIKINNLLSEYQISHNIRLQSNQIYQKILYTLSIALLFSIAYVLYRLNSTALTLRKTNKDLNYQKFAMDQHAIVSVTDSTGIITYANQKFCVLSGYSSSEILGQTYSIIKSDHHPEEYFSSLKLAKKNVQVWHGIIRNINKDKQYFWVDTTIVPFTNEKGKVYQFVSIQTNVTDIKDAQETLHLQSAALEVAANGIVITDKNANILWTNQAFSKMTGYHLGEVIGKTPAFLSSGKEDATFFKNMWDTILAGDSWHGELFNRRKDGSIYPEELTISPVVDSSGEISHFISIKQDISKRHLTEEALRRSQKMDAIGQLSGGIAHDFNNQLGIVLGYLDMLKSLFPDDVKTTKYVSTATKATLRCVELTRQLLAFSRKKTSESSVVNLNTLLTNQKVMITRSITPEIEVEYHLTDDLWSTKTNAGEFEDAILNMALNSRDAMPKGGKLIIESSNQTTDSSAMQNSTEKVAEEYVQISISDTGAGMDKNTQEHIYEPFFTTKPIDKGTGLGMAMVYGFVNRYNGHIKVYSELGVGTTIRMNLPRSKLEDSPVVAPVIEAQPPGGNESILIVDDEIDLLELANNYCQDLGYHTITATNARQALQILAGDKPINLLFSDVVMPGGINGYELAEKAVNENPGLKVLLTSGFTSHTITQNGLQRFSSTLLSKPYRKKDLAERIRLVLDEKSSV